jgi:hypothetical protein
MAVVLIAVSIVALVAAILALITRRRLIAQRELTRAADGRAAAKEADAAATAAALDAESKERAAATTLAEERGERAREAAARAEAAEAAARGAGERADAAEASLSALRDAAAPSAGLDPGVLWILEQARSERTWRFSVAPHPESPSVFADAADPLLAAVQVELDAAREDVGAVVELDAELPDGLTIGASVLALRATQELLADIVRRSEESTVRIRVDGGDLVVDIDAFDEHGEPVRPNPLPLPPSAAVEVTESGVRIHGALAPGSSTDA